MESIALCAAMLMPILLLQKPHARSKTKHHMKCLKRHLSHWNAGDIDALLDECRTIQSQFIGGLQSTGGLLMSST